MFQDPAYGTLPRGPRHASHRRIAEALERRYSDFVETRPEIDQERAGRGLRLGDRQKVAGVFEPGRNNPTNEVGDPKPVMHGEMDRSPDCAGLGPERFRSPQHGDNFRVLKDGLIVSRTSLDARRHAGERLFEIIDRVRLRSGQKRLTEKHIVEEVHAVRRARRARQGHD